MFKFILTLNAAVVFMACLVFTSVARAQTPQKFVSAKTGKDSTSCTINLPCRTFAAAILQVPPRGEIIALDVGDYGPVTITKAVTIAGPAGGHAGINLALAAAVTINAGSSDTVILRGLALSGPGSNRPPLAPDALGILFQAGEALIVENCVIDGFSGPGIAFNSVGQLFVHDTIVRNCKRNGINSGISVGTSSGKTLAYIDRCQLEKNDYGLTASGNAKITVSNSAAEGNGEVGFAVTASFGAAAEMNIENCVATGSRIGIFSTSGIAGGGTLIRVSNSTVTNNIPEYLILRVGEHFRAGTIQSKGIS